MTSTDTDPDGAPEAQEKPKLSLDVQVEKRGACQRHVIVSVSHPDVERYVKDAYDELQPKAEVPGFRAGRAPRKLVEAKFKDQIRDQVKGSLLMDALSQLGDEHEFSAISEPELDLDAVAIPDDGPLTFEFDIEVRPEFDMPNWKGLRLERPVHEYSDQEIQKQLQELLRRHGKVTAREGGVERDDLVTVDILVELDGKTISEHKGVELRVLPDLSVRDGVIEGFDTLVVGATNGETRETDVTISNDGDNEALCGQRVHVVFKIRAVKYVELPALTPAFLDDIGEFEDEDDLREAVRREMERQLEYRQQRQFRDQITRALTQTADWELPPDLLRRQASRELDRIVLELRSSGFDEAAIQAHANAIRRNSQLNTERALKEHFIFERIAEDEEIDAGPDDFDAEVLRIAEQSDEPPRRVRARLEKRGQMDALRNQIVERKVIELICSHATFTEVPLEPSEDDRVFAADLALAGRRDAANIPEAKHGGEAESLREPVDRT